MKKCEIRPISGQLGPFSVPLARPEEGTKIKMYSKVSYKVGFVPQSRSFGFLYPFSAVFWRKSAKKPYFPIFPIHLYRRIALKQNRDAKI